MKELFDDIYNSNCNSSHFDRVCFNFFKENLEYIKSIDINEKCSEYSFLNQIKQKLLKKDIKNIDKIENADNYLQIFNLIKDLYNIYKSFFVGQFHEKDIVDIFPLYVVCLLLYPEHYYYKKIFTNNINSIQNKFPQISTDPRYGLIKYDTKMKIINTAHQRYLQQPDFGTECFNIEHIPFIVLKNIEDIYNKKFINTLYFKVFNVEYQPLNKTTVYGKKLSINIKELPSISSFKDYKKEDKLIIKHTTNEITFEEIYKDYKTDDYYTQVVHLLYTEKNKEYFIQHIDHEYILYTDEEYINKMKNEKVKGKKAKYKTFKIDDSSIPFFYKDSDNQYFLYNILYSFFENKELLNEYFEDILSLPIIKKDE